MSRLFFRLLLLAVIGLNYSCSGLVDKFKDKTWTGNIYRTEDQKELSKVMLKFTDDTLFIYSNAIFGADNDTLAIQNVNEKDSTILLRNKQGETFSIFFEYEQSKHTENFYIYSNDYYIALDKSNADVTEEGAIDFYKDKVVPRKAAYYLDGTYVGQLQMENQLQNAFLASTGGIGFKYVFMEDFKVKAYSQGAMIGLFNNGRNSMETMSYTIKGDRIYFDGKKGYLEIKENGNVLVMQEGQMNLVLNKIY